MTGCSLKAFGISHCGRRNVLRRRAVCPHCHSVATLTSCDARAYLSLLFLPLIPLGRKRVVDECETCGDKFTVPAEQWQLSKRERFEEARRQYEDKPRDPAAIEEIVATYEAFQDREAFLELAPRILRDVPGDTATLRLIGDGYLQFGRYDEAVRVLHRSLEIEDDADTREFIGEALIRNMRPDEAAPYLEHIFRTEDKTRVGYLCLLAQGYQALGQHHRALQVMRRVRSIFPSVARSREFRHSRRVARRHAESRRPVVARSLRNPPIEVYRGAGLASRLTVLIGPALLLLIAAAFLVSLQNRRRPSVWLVNGLSHPYRVHAGDTAYCLYPGRPMAVRSCDTPLEVHVAESGLDIPATHVSLRVPLITPPWRRVAAVVNPDGAALLTESDGDRERILTGKTSYLVRTGEDREAPQVADPDRPAYAVFDAMHDSVGLDAMEAMARHRLRGEPDSERLLRTLVRHWAAEPHSALAVVEYLQKGIERHDGNLTWARVYQDWQAETVPLAVLHSEYRARRSNGADALRDAYLTARVTPDPASALREVERIASQDDASAYALYDLALCRLGEGRIDDALALARRAKDADPRATIFSDLVEMMEHGVKGAACLELGYRDDIFRTMLADDANAAALLQDNPGPEAGSWLLAWIETERQGKESEADMLWKRAIRDLRRSVSLAALRAADELEKGPDSQTPAPCAAALLPPADKAVVLVAMGLRHPEVRGRCFEIARTIARGDCEIARYVRTVMNEKR